MGKYGTKHVVIPLFELVVGVNGEGNTSIEASYLSPPVKFKEGKEQEFKDTVDKAAAAFIRQFSEDIKEGMGPKGIGFAGLDTDSGPLAEVVAEIGAKPIEPVGEEQQPAEDGRTYRPFYSLQLSVAEDGHTQGASNFHGDKLLEDPVIPLEIATACMAVAMTISALAQQLTAEMCPDHKHDEEEKADDSSDSETKTGGSGKRVYPPNVH